LNWNKEEVEQIYKKHCDTPSHIYKHLPRLLKLASECEIVCEIGVSTGRSSSALILGAKYKVFSVDMNFTSQARELEAFAEDKWRYIISKSVLAPLPNCDMLFIDGEHTYYALNSELRRFADKAKKYLVFHDTITFGSFGAKKETGTFLVDPNTVPTNPLQDAEGLGIRPAIDELMIRDPSWKIKAHYVDCNGLLVLERTK